MAAGRLRMGLVGAGLVGQAEHAFYLWEDREHFELVALADPSQIVRTSLAARYGIAETRERVDQLFDLELDAIVCAAPDGYHHEVTTSALRAGLHVLCGEAARAQRRRLRGHRKPLGVDRPRRPGRHHEAL